MRKKMGGAVYRGTCRYVMPDPADYKGRWKQLFQTDSLHVEIGMGKGDYLHTMALASPDTGWVGIEKDHSAAAVALRKLIEPMPTDGRNERMIVGDAAAITEWFQRRRNRCDTSEFFGSLAENLYP